MIGQLFRLNLTQMGFWASWTMIPILVEIIPSLISITRVFINLLRNSKKKEKMNFPEVKPYVSIIIPVYNSKDSLYACIKSVDNSSYPRELMQIILVDNKPGGDKECFDIFDQMHNHEFSHLNMAYLRSAPGKAKALNTAIYSCIGTYIVNIDSDGILEKDAISNLVLKYENDNSISAMTGVILTQKEMIQSGKSLYKKILQKNEYFEYAQSFLTGRTKETKNNQLFTMAGAFSSFRKEVLISTFLYDVDTVGEDTDMTFQIRINGGQKVDICEDAFFFVDPVGDLDTLYIQRQRWQRGQLEVVGNYMTGHNHITGFFKDFLVRRMIIDHTFIFPKMIWLFASFILIQFGYSYRMILLSYGLIYLLYFFVSGLNSICTLLFFKKFKEERHFYVRNLWCLLSLPIYIFICSWFRLIGVINSITSPAKWDTEKFKEEKKKVFDMIRNDFIKVKKVGKVINEKDL